MDLLCSCKKCMDKKECINHLKRLCLLYATIPTTLTSKLNFKHFIFNGIRIGAIGVLAEYLIVVYVRRCITIFITFTHRWWIFDSIRKLEKKINLSLERNERKKVLNRLALLLNWILMNFLVKKYWKRSQECW